MRNTRRPSLHQHSLLLGALFAVLVLLMVVAGAAAAVRTNPAITGRTGSAAHQTAAAGAAKVIVESHYAGQPNDFRRLATEADLVIEGVIQETLPAQWTTADGRAPTTFHGPGANPKDQIRTPIRLSVTRAFKGARVGDAVTFSIVGGRVGDTALLTEDLDTYAKGQRVIVFLSKGGPDNPATVVHPAGLYPVMTLVVEGGVARGPVKAIPLTELVPQLVGR